MLKRLRREFIAITMLLVGLVLAGVLGITFFANAASLRAGADRILDRAVERGVSVGQLGDPTGTMGSDYMLAAVVDISREGRSSSSTRPPSTSPSRRSAPSFSTPPRATRARVAATNTRSCGSAPRRPGATG